MTLCSSKSRFCLAFAQYEIGSFITLCPFELAEFIHRRTGKNRWIGTTTSKLVTGGSVPENWKTMTREEFLSEMDEILGLRPGTLRGDEKLDELQNWDSAALVQLIVLAETTNNAQVSLDEVVGCSTVADLLRLAQVDGSSS
jgi:acyl carrier protein